MHVYTLVYPGIQSRDVFCGSQSGGNDVVSDDAQCAAIEATIGPKPSATKACGTSACQKEEYARLLSLPIAAVVLCSWLLCRC